MLALNELWHLKGDVAVQLRKRSATLSDLPKSTTPDYCEMNVVANSTGMALACEALSYPLCRIIELADVFISGAGWRRSEAYRRVVDLFHCPFVVAEFSIFTPSAPPGLIHSNNTTK